jgi:hypothetical protein
MDNTTDGIAVSINVYGKTVRQGFIQFFDPVKNTVTRTYPPRTLKEVLAVKTLAAIDPGRAEGSSGRASPHRDPRSSGRNTRRPSETPGLNAEMQIPLYPPLSKGKERGFSLP